MGKKAWSPSETSVCDKEPSGLFHGVNMGHGAWGMGKKRGRGGEEVNVGIYPDLAG